ncbi:MAG TPA: aspartyl protease family protein [Acidobacteriaceae bacterium]
MHLRTTARWVVVALAMAGGAGRVVGQAGGPAGGSPAAGGTASGGKLTCTIDHRTPSEPEKALRARRFADAERLFGEALTAAPASSDAMAGLVRTTLAEDKLPEALALAIKFDKEHPSDPVLIDALGEVRFRRGEVQEAANAFIQSNKLDPCNGLTHFDVARYLNLSGMYLSSQRQLEIAHTLSPDNPQIERRWRTTHAIPRTPDQQLAFLRERVANAPPSMTDEVKEGIQAAIKGIETREKGSCQLVSPVQETKLPIVPISNGVAQTQEDIQGAGLDVLFNGKRKRLEIDTGASGILLSRSAARNAGLVPELEIKSGGIGDEGLASAFVTHVDDIKVGSMEFKNCMVQVLEKSSALDIDGLIGPDVFRDYLVTLDIPGREVRIGPLPKRPDEAPSKPTGLATSDVEETPLSIADRAKDPYVAPEMKDWTPVFRAGHDLIFPTMIGNAPVKLFMMDTGAQHGMITPAAAREVTHVSGNTDMRVRGINGEVKNVMVADRVTITFARVQQMLPDMTAYDSSMLAHTAGVEISGLIGFPTLRELVISIDYRDNLVHVVYDPKKGFHAH